MPLLLLSFILSFSRTGLITTIILSFSILGFIDRFNWRLILSIGSLVFVFAILITTTHTSEVGTFRSKIARSVIELKISDYTDMVDINRNWRGFETYKALDKFIEGNTKQKLFGYGFGSLIDLGFTMTLNEVNFRKIPITHNGYAYILVKTGLLGILCYVFFYFRLIKHSLKSNSSITKDQILLPRLLLGFTLCLMFSMIVVGGIAEIHDSEYVLFLGFILRQIEN